MVQARSRCRSTIAVACLAFGFSLELAFFTITLNKKVSIDPRVRVVEPSTLNKKVSIDPRVRAVKLGDEYTGKVVKVNKLSIEAEFKLESTGTSFLGSLNIEDMGRNTAIDTTGRQYAFGDQVTAKAWKYEPGRVKMSQNEARDFAWEGVELGKEYTGTIVKLHRLSVDAEFQNGDSAFWGNLHIADMGVENEIDTPGHVYGLGDKVIATARKWTKTRTSLPKVRMSKNNAEFENKKSLKDFSVGDVVTGRFINSGGRKFAFFDVGALVDGALDTERYDIDINSLAPGTSMPLKVEEVKAMQIWLGI
eukprot:TRINITY_DN6305_c0_g1_i7.p1 TRINITY_DN6305_c0_g1~~TRINITY_DN6305_c0_g1_i7.p1  ORF type:complete len:307 (+),score=53.12 TRINITY_DN6305_c0_g1_i7:66-986(+)